MLFETSADVLNMSLALGVVVLTIFLSMFLFYAILVLRDVSKITDDVEEVTSRVRKTVVEPLKLVDSVMEKAKTYIESAVDRVISKED